ncbi:MAG: glycosyltransferase [Leucobacter sp.]
MSKQIAFVIHQLGGIGAGGVDRVASLLANEFAERGWQVDILVMSSNTLIERDLSKEITVRFEAPSRSNAGFIQNVQRILRGVGLVRNYAKEHPDAVIVSFIHWINVCTVLGVTGIKHGPVILSERTDPASDPAHRIARRIRDVGYGRADALVFQTLDAQKYFSRIRDVECAVIANPVSPGLPAWKQPPPGHVEIVTAARLEEEKNLPMLIDAFRPIAIERPDARLRIYGKGRVHDSLQRQIDEAGLADSVKLEGFARDVHERMSTASMFVLSSNFEGLPNALLEAMSMGMPVISTDCPIGGPRMLIDDGVNGLLVPVDDAEAMSAQMQKLVHDEEEARRLGAAAAQSRERYSSARIADSWESFIRALQGSAAKAAR